MVELMVAKKIDNITKATEAFTTQNMQKLIRPLNYGGLKMSPHIQIKTTLPKVDDIC